MTGDRRSYLSSSWPVVDNVKRVYLMSRSDVHVIPVNDLKEHRESRRCWCKPAVKKGPGWQSALVTHQSADGRELVERHGLH